MTDQEVMAAAYKTASRRPFYVAQAIENYRVGLGYTQVEICRWLGIDEATLFRFGLCRLTDDLGPLQRIATKYGIDFEKVRLII